MTTVAHRGRRAVAAADASIQHGVERVRRQARPYISLNGAAMVGIAALAIGVIGILYLIQTSQVAELGYQLSHLQSQHDDLALDNSRLAYQVGRYESLDTIQQVATQQLGMTHLENYQFLQVQRPPQENLIPLPAEHFPNRSLFERAKGALLGIGHSHGVEGPSTLPPVGKGN
jgi:cell division protein FtsL